MGNVLAIPPKASDAALSKDIQNRLTTIKPPTLVAPVPVLKPHRQDEPADSPVSDLIPPQPSAPPSPTKEPQAPRLESAARALSNGIDVSFIRFIDADGIHFHFRHVFFVLIFQTYDSRGS